MQQFIASLTESILEVTAFESRRNLGYSILFGNDITLGYRLTSLRDSLLPKLIRGEVRVKEVEKNI
ncbi:MAG: hypothetical protein M1485_04825 [Chloroflexi bacterium]|nr:hypothetical protein [Chloroflexota bacterium]